MERSYPRAEPAPTLKRTASLRVLLPLLLAAAAALIALGVGLYYRGLPHDAALLTDSTLGEMAAWMAGQAENEVPPSLFGSFARQYTLSAADGDARLTALLGLMQTLFLVWCAVSAALIAAGIAGLVLRASWTRAVLIGGLIGLDTLLFLIPVLTGDSTVAFIIIGIVLMLVVLLMAPGSVTPLIGFVVAMSSIFVIWESVKWVSDSLNYQILVPQPAWNTSTYSTLEDALAALEAGDVRAVFADSRDLEAFMPGVPPRDAEPENLPKSDLRYLRRLPSQEQVLWFAVTPPLPGRLSAAVRAADAESVGNATALIGEPVGAVAGEFAADRYLALERNLVLLDMNITNDLNLPHLQSIAEAFLQPARRNGDFLLMRILGEAGLYTWREALLGFTFGVIFGLLLGTAFAHSRLMERALLPYVVASQTVPILAIAPMVVIWLGANFASVAVIAAYITFFPVTINTLRGLHSPSPTQIELLHSYAARWWTILFKLRFPAALPYIFTAMKVSATASVVGAVIGELPSGISDGLGRAILNFSSDYSLVSTPKLWAAIIIAAAVGGVFFLIVSLVERIVLRRYLRSE
jgi:NitT/TauT family transport system permease protein